MTDSGSCFRRRAYPATYTATTSTEGTPSSATRGPLTVDRLKRGTRNLIAIDNWLSCPHIDR
jgi:hypothetical protein